jgi:hypothetical protein
LDLNLVPGDWLGCEMPVTGEPLIFDLLDLEPFIFYQIFALLFLLRAVA